MEKCAPHTKMAEKQAILIIITKILNVFLILPNRYGEIQNKLKQTNEAFEQSRLEAKTAKDEFFAVKQER
jgi:hypothetical protein